MSNHYNATRADYYRRLAAASRERSPMGFVAYAVRGFVDELRAQLDRIWAMQYEDRWEQYVYQRFGLLSTESQRRRLRLVKDISRASMVNAGDALPVLSPVPRSRLRLLTPELAALYSTKTDKTLTRDINAALKMGLSSGGARASSRPQTLCSASPRSPGSVVGRSSPARDASP